ncbi:MAG: Z1 domain-containing protein [Candidatus Xenobiia bacterium LiM19]
MSHENIQKIGNLVIASIPVDQLPTEESILELVKKFRTIFEITDDEFGEVVRMLHARLQISMDTGASIVEDHQPWLADCKPDIDPFYWNRYHKFLLLREKWPPRVLNTLDKVTDEILDDLGNPMVTSNWSRRGLVMGDVQSGKTSTYTGICCKAADAGYKLIILLTGTLETLRRQTQERLDAGFVGLDSSGMLNYQRTTREVGVGSLDKRRTAGVFTSTKKDFKSELMNQLGFRLNSFKEPVLVVIKKNKRILENLENWLRSYNAGKDGKIDTPMLLIDDEADNASINTKPGSDDPTAINERIRALLNLFTRSSYIGFTATPFANIFIDPESENEMVGDDLFPKHFIYALEVPTNYVGAQSIFGEDTGHDCLREIEDADSVFPEKHNRSLQVQSLPGSLMEALNSFIISNAIRDLRGEENTHRSMLVNVSRFTDVQDQVAALLDQELRDINSEIRNYSQLAPDEACRSLRIAALRRIWKREFEPDAGFTWINIQHALPGASLPIEVRSVNQRTGAASLDYSAYRNTGLRVVAVGGNSLSRGLTLEGLAASYFYRNSQMYDTLLQMGRWFGYRDGYADLCRLWLSEEAVHWYRHISLASEELRREIRYMQNLNLTPREFGLKVRAHPDSLIVTARNKMRSSHVIERIISVNARVLETSRLHRKLDHIRANAMAAEELVKELNTLGIRRCISPYRNSIWSDVPRTPIINFLRRFETHPLNFDFQREDLASFIERTDEAKLQNWDVVLPNGELPETMFAGIPYRPQKRKVQSSKSGSILVSGKSARVGSRGIEKEGVPETDVRSINANARRENRNVSDEEYRKCRPRPLFLLHLLKPFIKEKNGEAEFDTGGFPLAAVSLSFPSFDDSDASRRVKYRVNLVEWRNYFSEETDDDQEVEDVI